MKRAGITIKVAVPVIEKMKGIYIFLDNFNQYMLSLKTKNLAISYKDKPIHAKIMIVDDKKVLLGSHNLTNRGVLMGTEELAIVSTDPYFLSQATSFIKHVNTR